jgi:hypothetical protein
MLLLLNLFSQALNQVLTAAAVVVSGKELQIKPAIHTLSPFPSSVFWWCRHPEPERAALRAS